MPVAEEKDVALPNVEIVKETPNELICAAGRTLSDACQPIWSFADNTVAILGFLGVIITIYGTSLANRCSRKREIAHEVSSIKASLLADVTVIVKALKKQIDEKIPEEDYTALLPKWDYRIVFESVASKIGLLGPELSKDLVKAYLSLKQFDNYVGAFLANKENSQSPHHHELRPNAMITYQKWLPALLKDFQHLQDGLER